MTRGVSKGCVSSGGYGRGDQQACAPDLLCLPDVALATFDTPITSRCIVWSLPLAAVAGVGGGMVRSLSLQRRQASSGQSGAGGCVSGRPQVTLEGDRPPASSWASAPHFSPSSPARRRTKLVRDRGKAQTDFRASMQPRALRQAGLGARWEKLAALGDSGQHATRAVISVQDSALQ